MDSSPRQLPVLPGRPLFRDSNWRSVRKNAVSGDDFSRCHSFASDEASSVDLYCQEGEEFGESRLLRQYLDPHSQGEDKLREARFLQEMPLVESYSTSDSKGETYDSVPFLDAIDHFVFSFPQSIIPKVLSSTSFSKAVASTASSSVCHDEVDCGSVMSVSHSEDSHAANGHEAVRTISNGTVVSVRYSDDFNTVGQGIERTTSNSMDCQGHAESVHELDQVNDGHATTTIVSNADGHEAVYSDDRISSLLSQEAARELSFPGQLLCIAKSPITSFASMIKSATPATKASAPRTLTPDVGFKSFDASLALKLTPYCSMGTRVGRCHDEEHDGLVVHLVDSHASIVGQEVECTIIGHVDSNKAPDHEDYGHAIHSMTSDAGGQEAEYSKDRVSSLLSTDNVQEPDLSEDPPITTVVTRKPTPLANMISEYYAMRAPVPPTTELTARTFLSSRVGRRHEEENCGPVFHLMDSCSRGQGLQTIEKDSTHSDVGLSFSKVSITQSDSDSGYIIPEPTLTPEYSEGVECEVPNDRNTNAADLRDSTLVAEPSALPIRLMKSVSGDFLKQSSKWEAKRPMASNEASKKEISPSSRPKSPRRKQQWCQEDKYRAENALDSSSNLKIGASFTETPSTVCIVTKISHSLESIHASSESSVLKTLLSAAFGESLCHCSGDLASNNETEESEPNDVDQIECMLHKDELRHPMSVQIEIQTASPSAAMLVTVPYQGKARSYPTLKSLSKRLPCLRPESQPLHGRFANQLSQQPEGRNDTEEPRVGRGGPKRSSEQDEMVSIIAAESGDNDPLQIPTKILKVRPHPESSLHRSSRNLKQMPEQNQTPVKKKARNGTEEARVGHGGCKHLVESDGVHSISAVKNGNRRQSQIPSKILRPNPESRFLRGRRKRCQTPEQNQTLKTEESKETEGPRKLVVCESDDFF